MFLGDRQTTLSKHTMSLVFEGSHIRRALRQRLQAVGRNDNDTADVRVNDISRAHDNSANFDGLIDSRKTYLRVVDGFPSRVSSE